MADCIPLCGEYDLLGQYPTPLFWTFHFIHSLMNYFSLPATFKELFLVLENRENKT